jgi:predicted nucleotidyltransferase component of viral defense system
VINRTEIEAKSAELGVKIADVERDYVFGWLLSAIYSSSNGLGSRLVLKGGNGLLKAYFPYSRFSADLDFSSQTQVDTDDVGRELNKACEVINAAAGVNFVTERTQVLQKKSSDEEQKMYEARLYFRDFYGNPNTIVLKVKLDISELDRIYLPVQERNLLHLYSDAKKCTGVVRCLKLEEMLAAKLKCLLQRRMSSDLYDYVYAIFINRELEVNPREIVSVVLKKTIFEPSPRALAGLLLGLPFQVLRAAWDKYVVTPVSSLIDFDMAVEQFSNSMRTMFAQFSETGANVAYFPAGLRNKIMEAAADLKVLRVAYAGITRVVEPYSLVFKRRRDGFGQEYLYVWDQTGGNRGGPGLKSFVHDRIESLEILTDHYEPRVPVEISKAGEFAGNSYFARPFGGGGGGRPRRARARVRSYYGTSLVYVVECSYCHRRFTRTRYRTRLKRHHDQSGNRCFSVGGYLVDQRYR